MYSFYYQLYTWEGQTNPRHLSYEFYYKIQMTLLVVTHSMSFNARMQEHRFNVEN